MNIICRQTVDKAIAEVGAVFGYIEDGQKYAVTGCDSSTLCNFYEKTLRLTIDDLLMIYHDGKFPYSYDQDNELINQLKEVISTYWNPEITKCLHNAMREQCFQFNEKYKKATFTQLLDYYYEATKDENKVAEINHHAEMQARNNLLSNDNFNWDIRIGIASEVGNRNGFLYVKYDIRMNTNCEKHISRFKSKAFDIENQSEINSALKEMTTVLGIGKCPNP